LHALVPPGLERCAEADLEGALELSRTLARYEGQVVAFEARTTAARDDATPLQRAEARADAQWGSDLLAVRTPRLHLLCAPEAPRAIARAIAFGELACRGLEPLFGDTLRDGPPLEPLVVQVYESPLRLGKTAALSASDEPRTDDPLFAHFDPAALVTHVAFPADAVAEAWARARFVHAIAHHWLRERCPRFSQALSRRASRKEPGYWVAEGLAGFAEELEYDALEASVRRPSGPTESLVLLTSLPPTSLQDWDGVLRCTQSDAARQNELGSGSVWRRGWLGLTHPTAPLDVYAAQATALVHYLVESDGGRRLAQLADFAHAYYIGTADRRRDLEASFDMTPEELGAAVQEWASAGER
jgi:hypothetical protein